MPMTATKRSARERIAARLVDPTLQRLFSHDPALYNVEVYNMGIFRYEGLYIGLPSMFHSVGPFKPDYPNTEGFHLVHLAWSRDLQTWGRLDGRQPFIGQSPSGAGAYDITQILGPSARCSTVTRSGSTTPASSIAAAANWADSTPSIRTAGQSAWRCCAGTALCPLDAGNATGVLVTKPFRLSGQTPPRECHGGAWRAVRPATRPGRHRARHVRALAGRAAAWRATLAGRRSAAVAGSPGGPAVHAAPGPFLLLLVRVSRCRSQSVGWQFG